ncbi:MAG: hypothetical protein II377_06015, partial [Clostridia bacterium]|nr:hypothetical protein [Clostridia bacterium]
MDEPKKVLKRILYFVFLLVLTTVFLIAAFLTVVTIQSKHVNNAAGVALEMPYKALDVFTVQEEKLCAVVCEDGGYALYHATGPVENMDLYLLLDDMQVGKTYSVPDPEESYAFMTAVYENKDDVPKNAYKTVTLKAGD